MFRRIPLPVLAGLAVTLLVVMIGAVTLFASSVIGRTVVEQFQVQQLQLSTTMAQQARAYFSELSGEAFQLARTDEIRDDDPPRTISARRAIETAIEQDNRENVVLSVTRFDLDGEPLYAWPESNHDLIGDEDYPYGIPDDLIQQPATVDEQVGFEPVLFRMPTGAGRYAYLLIAPVQVASTDGDETAVATIEFLAYELNMETIFEEISGLVLDELKGTETGQLWVFDYENADVYQARPSPQVDVARQVLPAGIGALDRVDGPESQTYVVDGVEREAALAPVTILDRKFVMFLSRDTEEVRAIVQDDLRLIFITAVVAVVLLLGLVGGGLRRLLQATTERETEASMRRATRSLLEVSRALNSSLELQTVLSRILSELGNLIPYYSASILLLNERGELEVASHRGEDAAVHDRTTFSAEETRAAREVIARGHPVVINDTQADERWTPIPGSDIHSWIGLPLRVFDQSVGVLNINNNRRSGFTMRELELAETYSDQASVALQNARLHEREVTRIGQELELAHGIQTSLMPATAPNIPGLEIVFKTLPAQQVSGDYFQLIPLSNGQLGIFVGDVSGKGIPAALVMAIINTTMREEVAREHDPGQLLNRLNERLLERLLQNQMNSALLAAVFDPETHQLTIANAGMVQPYLRTNGADWDFVDVGGYPLGASQRTNYSSRTLAIEPGTLMVMFSDGIIEAQNPRGEFFGFERLEVLLEATPSEISSQTVLDNILQAVERHLATEDAQDDITVMVLRGLEVEKPEFEPVAISSPVVAAVGTDRKETPIRRRGTGRLVSAHPAQLVDHEEYLMPRENVELFLPSVLGFEKVARSAAEAIARKMGFSDDRVDDLKTAVAEACMNAIEHGNLEDKATSVTVLLSASSDHLEIRVVDRGRQQIPDPLPPPGASGNDRGWGLFFIQNLMDDVEIVRLPEGNVVRMTIFLGKEDIDRSKSEPSPDASEWIDQKE